MSSVPLNVAYREKRTYVHGTDMYNEILRIVSDRAGRPADGAVRLNIRKMTGSGLDLIFENGAEEDTRGLVADFRVDSGATTLAGRLVESDRAVTNRIPYDEAAIRSKSTQTDQSARMTADPGFTPIEVLVSVTLDLLNKLMPPPEGKRWVFTRLDISRPLRDADRGVFSVTLTKALGRTLARFSVTADAPLGDIFFSLA